METEVLAPSVAETLDKLAAEIELAGARCILLDKVIGEAMDHLADADRESMMQKLHDVDLLSQQLTGLSAFARRLSQVVPADYTAPVNGAISEITLGSLADRLSAGLGGADDRGDPPPSGDLDLF